MSIILASSSPRRRELLTLAGIEHTVVPSECEEKLPEKITPQDAVKLLAKQKADDVSSRFPEETVLAADTVVALGDKILGKPKDDCDAFDMLSLLSGKIHNVFTGVCIKSAEREDVFSSATRVEFYPLTPDEIEEYIRTREPLDKAGAYGIQGKGSLLVKSISGDYFNVVGLPLAETVRRLKNF